MPQVTYVYADGTRSTCQVAVGDTVMDGAVDNAIPGIIAQCGGGCTCATCHCYVLAPALESLPPPHPDELEMLEYVWERRDNSRLACQVRLDEGVGTVEVEVPAQQA